MILILSGQSDSALKVSQTLSFVVTESTSASLERRSKWHWLGGRRNRWQTDLRRGMPDRSSEGRSHRHGVPRTLPNRRRRSFSKNASLYRRNPFSKNLQVLGSANDKYFLVDYR
eukprot:g80881.t1